MSDVTKLLAQAADVVMRRGWCQHWYGEPGGAVCAIGALYSAGYCGSGLLARP